MRLFAPKPEKKLGRPGGPKKDGGAPAKEEQMTPGELIRLGTKMHGREWHAALAEDVGCKFADVHFWAKGEAEIPRTIARFVRVLYQMSSMERERLVRKARGAAD